eukprot:9183240-Ditylum_brightwellii.AAC.1
MGGGVAALGNRSSRNKSKKTYDEGVMYSYYHDPELLLQTPCSGDESRSLVAQAPAQNLPDLNSLTYCKLMSDVTHTSLAHKGKSRQNILNHQKKLVGVCNVKTAVYVDLHKERIDVTYNAIKQEELKFWLDDVIKSVYCGWKLVKACTYHSFAAMEGVLKRADYPLIYNPDEEMIKKSHRQQQTDDLMEVARILGSTT